MKKQPVTRTLMVDVEFLGRGLKDGSIDVPRMIYIVPTHQNPTGK
jgi:DNA-binding transcriptional MocR family regulator